MDSVASKVKHSRQARIKLNAARVGGAAAVAAILMSLLGGCAPTRTAPGASRPAPVEKGTGTLPSKMSARDSRAILTYHNKVRADVGVGPLEWSALLAGYAQEWADHLASTTCKMAHRTTHLYGENLFQGTAGYYSAVDAAKAWETEKKDYGGGALSEANWHPAGHYTQMVWRGTTWVGCGEAVCAKTLIVACNYDPPGNVIGRRPY